MVTKFLTVKNAAAFLALGPGRFLSSEEFWPLAARFPLNLHSVEAQQHPVSGQCSCNHRCRAAPRQTDEPALSVKERREQHKALAKEAGLSRRALERQSGIQRPGGSFFGPRWTPAQKTSSKAAPLGGGRAPTTHSLVPRLGKGPSHCTLKQSKPFSEDWCRELEN